MSLIRRPTGSDCSPDEPLRYPGSCGPAYRKCSCGLPVCGKDAALVSRKIGTRPASNAGRVFCGSCVATGGPVSANHVEAAAPVACGLFRARVPPGRLIRVCLFEIGLGPRVPRQWRVSQPQVRQAAMEPAEVVVVMQHPLTTFPGKAITLKKSADAYVFRFPVRAGHSRLARLKKLQCSRPLSLGAGKSG
jgi:hypothetical protein